VKCQNVNFADNIYNKKALNLVGGAKGGLVWTVATAQLIVGALWVIPLWLLGLRKAPKMTLDNWKELAPIGLWSAGAHGGSVVALGAGAVSFGQILKACEPAFSAVNEVIITGHAQKWQVYATLIPIIGGVALASLSELSFSWLAVVSAMIANESAALKGVMGKNVMKQPWVKAMGAANQYGVVNILSVIFCIPLVLGLEGPNMAASWKNALAKGTTEKVHVFQKQCSIHGL
jgi:solute carrier family 35 protein E1